MRHPKFISLLLPLGFVLMLIAGCKKEDPVLEIDPVPYITLDGVSSTTIQEFSSDLVVNVGYEDEDGDLGFVNPDSLSIEVWDSRLSQPDLYHLQPLAPDTTLHITGTINVVILSPFLLGNGNSEVVNYSIRLRDRAGNWSNTIVTDDITIIE